MPYVGSLAYLLKRYLSNDGILERAKLVAIIVTLRKSIFSTLREIAYVANCLKIMETGLEPRKIKDIVMKDGGTPVLIFSLGLEKARLHRGPDPAEARSIKYMRNDLG